MWVKPGHRLIWVQKEGWLHNTEDPVGAKVKVPPYTGKVVIDTHLFMKCVILVLPALD